MKEKGWKMALKTGIEINKGDLKTIYKYLDKLGQYPQIVGKVLKKEADKTVAKMQAEAPFDTGRLRRNIEIYSISNFDVQIRSEAIDPQTGVDYAPIREYGLDGFPPNPYFRRNVQIFFKNLYQRLYYQLKKINKGK